MSRLYRILGFLGVCLPMISCASAQNMGTVFSPVVDRGLSSIEYRYGYQPEGNSYAQRLQYQYGLTDSWLIKGIFQVNQNDQSKLNFQYLRLEAMWQFIEEDIEGWASAMRFSLQIPEDDVSAYRAGIAWSGLYNIDENWQFRLNALIKKEFGANQESGLFPGVRTQISRKITRHARLCLDYFGGHNNITLFRNFDSSQHQIGPLLEVHISEGWKADAGVLFGVSQASADVCYRFNLAWSF